MTSDQVVAQWIGKSMEDPPGEIVCERGFIENWLEATQNANPIFWDAQEATRVAGAEIAPPTMLSVWMRPRTWRPGRSTPAVPLLLHFQLKEALGLPEGIVKSNEITFGVPVRVGDRVRTTQTIRDIGEPRANKLGTGRDWTIDVTYRNQRDEIVGVETYVMFGYVREPRA